MRTRNATQDTFGEVAQTLGDAVTDGAELVGDIASDLTDVAESAVSTVAATGKAGVRIVGRTLSFVARRPREVVIGIVAVAAVLAVLGYLKSRSAESDAA